MEFRRGEEVHVVSSSLNPGAQISILQQLCCPGCIGSCDLFPEPVACGAAARFQASKLLQANDVHRDVNPVNRERKLSTIAALYHHHYNAVARLPGPLSSTVLAALSHFNCRQCHHSSSPQVQPLVIALSTALDTSCPRQRSGHNNHNHNSSHHERPNSKEQTRANRSDDGYERRAASRPATNAHDAEAGRKADICRQHSSIRLGHSLAATTRPARHPADQSHTNTQWPASA
jgi:hypothetical protein